MSNEKRVKKLEDKISTDEELIEEIVIEIINPDGTLKGTLVSEKLENGKWTQYEEQS